jgi:hypothetical protein
MPVLITLLWDGEAAVPEHLQQGVGHVGVGFVDLVDQQHRWQPVVCRGCHRPPHRPVLDVPLVRSVKLRRRTTHGPACFCPSSLLAHHHEALGQHLCRRVLSNRPNDLLKLCVSQPFDEIDRVEQVQRLEAGVDDLDDRLLLT